MLNGSRFDRAYGPEELAVLGAAFDAACNSAPKRINGNDDTKPRLAAIILGLWDHGERDRKRLAEIGLQQWSATFNLKTSLSESVFRLRGFSRTANESPEPRASRATSATEYKLLPFSRRSLRVVT
jgi:hypothetical protein